MKQEPKSRNIQGVTVCLLFAVLAVCVLGVLLTGAGAYERLSERDQDGYQERTAVQYLSARVGHGDEAGAIFLRDFQGESALVLTEMVGDVVYETQIYSHQGYLCELYGVKDGGFGPEDGTELLEVGDLDFHLEQGLLTMTVTETDGTVKELYRVLRSEGRDAYEE